MKHMTLIEHLDLTAGLRYTHEAKDETANYSSPDGGCGLRHSFWARPRPRACFPTVSCCCLDMGAQRHSIRSSPGSRTPQSLSENYLNATVKLAYHFTDDVMGYASWGNGTKAGGFNLARVNNPAAADPLAPILDTEFPRETVQFLRDWRQERARRENRAPQCRRV